MKLLPILLCTVILSLGFVGCASAPKKQEASCCAAKSGSCDAPHHKMHKH
jgi:hypothetical protein